MRADDIRPVFALVAILSLPNRPLPSTVSFPSASRSWRQAINERPLPDDSRAREARLSKNKRYGGGKCDLTVERDQRCFFIEQWPATLPAIPLDESDLVVVGQVTDTAAYLSSDRTHVYTEVEVRLEEVLKTSADSGTVAGGSVVLDRIGGSIKLRTGQIVSDDSRIASLGMPRTGSRCVFFARKIHKNKDLSLIRVYELRDGRVLTISEDGGARQYSPINPVSSASDLERESAFLAKLRNQLGHVN
jgi:hypothetical protein